MNITKCDLCKKVIKKDQNKFNVSSSTPWIHIDVCETCGESLVPLLEKKIQSKHPVS
jgi:hypothetical protein